MRNPFVETLGVRYHPHFLNVVLLNVEPMQEKNVIDDIDQHLSGYRRGLWKADYARQKGCKINEGGPELEAFVAGKEEEHQASLLARPVHATVFGAFGIATVFTSTSFGLCHCFGGMDRVLSQQVLLGTVPSPTLDYSFDVLCQEPDDFLKPFHHAKLMGQTTVPSPDTAEFKAMQQPILVFSQLQVSGLISTISASNLVLPLMLALDRKLSDTVTRLGVGGQVTALLMDIQGWSDYVLILRTSSYEAANECVECVAGLTLEDLCQAWEDISKAAGDDVPLQAELKLELQAMDDRLERMGRYLAGKRAPLRSELTQQHTHLFGSSIATMGILWPYCHHAILHQDGRLGTNVIYDAWSISGETTATIQICTRPGHYCDVRKVANELRKLPGAAPLPVYPGSAFGTYNVIIPGEALSAIRDKPGRSLLKELVGRLYHFRWKLLAGSDAKGGTTPPIWFDEGEADVPVQGISILTGTSTLLWGVRQKMAEPHRAGEEPTALLDKEAVAWSLDAYYATFVRKTFSLRSSNDALEKLTGELKKKLVSWHLRDTLTQVMSLWRSEMADPTESNRMVELADCYLTWSQVLLTCLKNLSTKGEIERFLCTFTQPFGQAVVQRVLTGYHMSEYSDFTAEYKGGMTKNLTAIDGLMKSLLALVGSPQNTGGLALIGHDPMPTIEIGRVRSAKDEYAYAVMRLNFIHLVHPIKIATVLHEVLHVIVQSRGFGHALSSCGGTRLAQEIFPYNHHQRTLQQHRLEEMLIEHIVGYLLFADRPELYTRSYLVQMVLHADSFANTHEQNCMVIVEHLCRCYLLELLLKNPTGKMDMDPARLIEEIKLWWKANARYVLNAGEKNKALMDAYAQALIQTLEKWVCDESLLADIEILRDAVNLYFRNTKEYEDTEESRSLRHSFITRLEVFRNDQEKDMKELKQRLSRGEPVHIVFRKCRGERDQGERLLRVRRLESLVAYLCLIRTFYETLDEWLQRDPDSRLHLEREDGTIDFHGGTSNAFLLDRLRGTLFTVGETEHNTYALMRMSLLKSLWQLAEVTKHSEIIYLLTLGKKLSANNVQLFVPTALVEDVLPRDWEEQSIQAHAKAQSEKH